MSLKYLIDENLRGKFARALLEMGGREGIALDVLETGAAEGPPLGTTDDALILWAQAHGRVIISLDVNTLIDAFTRHTETGAISPGILLVRHSRSWDEILFHLVYLAAVSDPAEYENVAAYVPS
jgi:hypothetical protein